MLEKQKSILREAKEKLILFAKVFDPVLESNIYNKDFNELLAETIIPLGIALSAEKDTDILLYKILKGAKELCSADGGTLYLKHEDHLSFKIILNDTLKVDIRNHDDETSNFKPIPLYDAKTGEVNQKNVACVAAHRNEIIHIENAYENTEFDFSGTKIFDRANGYRSESFLAVPLCNYYGEVIGVLQLINCIDQKKKKVIPFPNMMREGVSPLAAMAATALENQLLLEAEKALMQSFIKLISDAIDRKSPYTGGHCNRVPEITMLLAEAAIRQKDGLFASFDLNQEEKEELSTAAWLHDIGKIITPLHVVDKATKLEGINDRIESVLLRCELRIKDLKIEAMDDPNHKERCDKDIQETLNHMQFLREVNLGGEFLSDEAIQRIHDISKLHFTGHGNKDIPLLTKDEVYNLCIRRGTLTEEERIIINQHIDVTIEMLESLPFPKHLKRVVEYAGGHHEKMDGTGYPKGLTKEQMSIPARMMAIADIFEALTASDRPYKKGKTLSEAIRIMCFMAKDQHIDIEIFELFLSEKLHEVYAKANLPEHQIDHVDVEEALKLAKG
jgi:HD-GYP domain-containing protein (c-di-GMP phosphodiesterase class II)